jgi:C4-dicarboxylate-binding protein DctP
MKKKMRILLVMVLVIAMTLVFSACTGGDKGSSAGDSSATAPETGDGGEAEPEDEIVELTLAHFGAVGSMVEEEYNTLQSAMLEESNGSLKVEVYGASSLISQPEAFEAVQSGRVDMSDFQVSYFSSSMPELEVLTVPGAYRGAQFEAQRTLLSEAIDQILQGYGLKLVATIPSDTQTFIGSIVVKDPANDLKGKTVRASGTWNGRGIEALGGSPVNMAIADVPTALERHTIDMVLSTWVAAEGFRLYEVAPHITMTEMQELFCGAIMNLDKYNSLSDNQKAALDRAGKTFEEFGIEIVESHKPAFVEKMEEEGVEVYTATLDDNKYYNSVAWEIIDNELAPNANAAAKGLIEALKDPSLQFN